jgi:mono/diheme cytochrome c family protein
VSASSRRAAGALSVLVLLSLPVSAAPSNDARVRGQALYSTYCAACHQASGEGMAGVFPPLKSSAVVNRADASKHIDIVLGGLQGARVSGVTYTNPMPAFAATLSDADIAAIIDYERGAWGNHGSLVGAAQVASERARLKQPSN